MLSSLSATRGLGFLQALMQQLPTGNRWAVWMSFHVHFLASYLDNILLARIPDLQEGGGDLRGVQYGHEPEKQERSRLRDQCRFPGVVHLAF